VDVSVVAWDPDSASADIQLNAVLTIHKANRARLGPMPDMAFRDRAKHHRHGGVQPAD
jgi:hypothetical protein